MRKRYSLPKSGPTQQRHRIVTNENLIWCPGHTQVGHVFNFLVRDLWYCDTETEREGFIQLKKKRTIQKGLQTVTHIHIAVTTISWSLEPAQHTAYIHTCILIHHFMTHGERWKERAHKLAGTQIHMGEWWEDLRKTTKMKKRQSKLDVLSVSHSISS